jgi:hypothetical protein
MLRIRTEGSFVLFEDGHVVPLPTGLSPHEPVALLGRSPIASFYGGETERYIWTPETCERMHVSGPAFSWFPSSAGSMRVFFPDGLGERSANGTWSRLAEPALDALKLPAPHGNPEEHDYRIETRHEGNQPFRLVAQRWGFPPVVVRELPGQPVEISSAPPRAGASPRVPAVIAHRALAPGGSGPMDPIEVELPHRAFGYAALAIDSGEEVRGCESSGNDSGERANRNRRVATLGPKLFRSSDDALWLALVRRQERCHFEGEYRNGPTPHSNPAEVPRLVIDDLRVELVVYAIREDGTPGATEVLRTEVPSGPGAPYEDARETSVAVSGRRAMFSFGEVTLWIDTAVLRR